MPQSISTSQNAQYSELTAIATSQRRRSGKGCLRRGAARRGAAGATAVLSVGRGRALFQPPRFTTPACFPPQWLPLYVIPPPYPFNPKAPI